MITMTHALLRLATDENFVADVMAVSALLHGASVARLARRDVAESGESDVLFRRPSTMDLNPDH